MSRQSHHEQRELEWLRQEVKAAAHLADAERIQILELVERLSR